MQALVTGLSVQLPKFEGPLSLLLYLIRKEEMDIMDIKIHQITTQYLEYIKLMKELDLELAGEFVAMAATLLQIKSRMLLPTYDENGEIVENEDPRKELVQRLLEYQKYQEAGQQLYERPLLGRDLFSRGVRERLDLRPEEIVIEENGLFSLISAYRWAMKGAQKRVHKVAEKMQSIAQRIRDISSKLLVGMKVPMSDLLTSTEKRHREVLMTFLSVLELGKMGLVRLFQSDTYQEIYIEAQKPIEESALSRVEEYESMPQTAQEALETVKIDLAEPEVGEDLGTSTWDFADGSGGGFDEASDQEIEVKAEEIASDEEIAAAELELHLVSTNDHEDGSSSNTGDLQI